MAAVDLKDIDDGTMQLLRKTFATLDKEHSGFIPTDSVGKALSNLGTAYEEEELDEAIGRVDNENSGKINFDGFVNIVACFMDEEDDEVIIEELRQAFRIYDREGNGYITAKVLREILHELDNKLTEQDLNDIIEEIDVDASGKIDFENFKNLML